jgi:chromosome segregation ATPase
MALTSTEIKRLLQPMRDFAPAILRCVEIVEAAEQAERTLAEQRADAATVQHDLAALALQREQAQASLATVQHEVAQKTRAAHEEIETLNISVQIVKDQLSAAQRDFETTQREHQKMLDELTVATQVKEDQLKERTSALAAFMAQFPAAK